MAHTRNQTVGRKAAGRMSPPLKMHGGKHYLANWIVSLMPPDHHKYVELFAGGLAVLWAKNPNGVSEVVNDIHHELMNFYAVLQDEVLFGKLMRRVTATPFGRPVWEEARSVLAEPAHDNPVERAAAFFVLNRQSFAGRMKEPAPLTKTRTRRGMNEQTSAWWTTIEGLPEVHERLKRVVIECCPAIELITRFDVEGAVLYADPPYPAGTRSAPDVYEFEMSDDDHAEFLKAANAVRSASMLISGYRCPLYDESLRHWNRKDFEVANHAASGESKERKLEAVWMNY